MKDLTSYSGPELKSEAIPWRGCHPMAMLLRHLLPDHVAAIRTYLWPHDPLRSQKETEKEARKRAFFGANPSTCRREQKAGEG